MKAYVAAEVEVMDESAADDHRRLASISDCGGRYLARGSGAEVVEGESAEGEPTERRVVIVEFPSPASAGEWHASSACTKSGRTLMYSTRLPSGLS